MYYDSGNSIIMHSADWAEEDVAEDKILISLYIRSGVLYALYSLLILI